jgi:hypothetical protein
VPLYGIFRIKMQKKQKSAQHRPEPMFICWQISCEWTFSKLWSKIFFRHTGTFKKRAWQTPKRRNTFLNILKLKTKIFQLNLQRRYCKENPSYTVKSSKTHWISYYHPFNVRWAGHTYKTSPHKTSPHKTSLRQKVFIQNDFGT